MKSLCGNFAIWGKRALKLVGTVGFEPTTPIPPEKCAISNTCKIAPKRSRPSRFVHDQFRAIFAETLRKSPL